MVTTEIMQFFSKLSKASWFCGMLKIFSISSVMILILCDVHVLYLALAYFEDSYSCIYDEKNYKGEYWGDLLTLGKFSHNLFCGLGNWLAAGMEMLSFLALMLLIPLSILTLILIFASWLIWKNKKSGVIIFLVLVSIVLIGWLFFFKNESFLDVNIISPTFLLIILCLNSIFCLINQCSKRQAHD